jgi:hypothetical protein
MIQQIQGMESNIIFKKEGDGIDGRGGIPLKPGHGIPNPLKAHNLLTAGFIKRDYSLTQVLLHPLCIVQNVEGI